MHWMMASDGSGFLANHDKDKPGSFAAVIYPYDGSNGVNESIGVRVGGSRIDTTNGQMEVAAAGHGMAGFIKALKGWGINPKGHTLHVVVDAQYVYCAYNAHPTKENEGFWMDNWKSRGWKTSSNKPVENQQLWHFLNRAIAELEGMGVSIVWHWVPGHDASLDVRNKLNNRVDSMCTLLVTNLRSMRQQERDKGDEPVYKGEAAWYQVVTTGETPELLGFPRLTTPKLSLFNHYEDMFKCSFKVKVITVNTVGVMGRGIAKQFADKYPEGEVAYKVMCARGGFRHRRVNTWVSPDGNTFLFAATKEHWKNPSQQSWVVQCAREIAALWPTLGGDAICMPPMGCGLGGLDWGVVKPLVLKELDNIPVVLFEGR